MKNKDPQRPCPRPYEFFSDPTEYYLSMLEAVPAMIWLSDTDARCCYFNRAWLDFTGRTLEEEAGDGWTEGLHKDDLERCLATYRESFGSRTNFEMEYRLRRHDGEYRWILDQGSPLTGPDGTFAGYVGTCYDIEDRKRHEEELRHRLSVENAVSKVSGRLVSCGTSAMDEALGLLGRAVDADRAYIFLLREDGRLIDNVSEWCAPGVAPHKQDLQAIETDGIPWWMERLRNNEDIIIRDASRLPDEAQAERSILEPQDIRSLLAVPMIFSGALKGFVGFDDTRGARDWCSEDVRLLRTASDVLAAYYERKRADQELEKFRFIIENASDEFYFIEPDGRFVYVNKAAADSLGYTVEEMLKMGVPDIDPGYGKDVFPRHFEEIGKRGEFPPFETTHIAKDGRAIPKEVHAVRLRIGGREYNCSFVRDITERKRAQRELEKFKFIIENTGEEFYMMDSSGRFTYVNQAAADSLGYTVEEMLGMGVSDISSGYSEALFREDMAFFEKNGFPQFETMHISKSGRAIPKEITALDLVIEGERQICCFGRDITERKRLERHRAEFAAMVTHDLKSPALAIIGYSDLIASEASRGNASPEDIVSLAASIKGSGNRLLDMVEDYLVVAKMDAGKLTANAFPRNVEDLVDEVCRDFGYITQSKGLAYHYEVQKGLPSVKADGKLLDRALTNLLDNAVTYTPAGGSVTFKASLQKEGGSEFIEFSVSDTGCGIPESEKARVFEKYYRAENVEEITGTGLGLAIVKAVAEAHGGSVEVESEPGKGSTFKLRLPVSSG